MDIAYFAKGRVGSLCREVIDRLGVTVLEPVDYHKADLWVSVHWPKLFSREQLATPKIGCVNLHNSYLPFNRGAHPCTWAIVDRTPAGATMHWMDEGIDTGDILYQERLEPKEFETADELYKRSVEAEVRVFKVGMELLLAGDYRRFPQPKGGTLHYKKDFERLIQAMTTSDSFVVRK
jgi:methionyl-tRNA formyltransferase